MNEISPVNHSHAPVTPLPTRLAGLDATHGSSAPSGAGDDQVELSQVARLLNLLDQGPVRQELVAEVRGQIDAGTYDTEDKLNAAIEKLISDL